MKISDMKILFEEHFRPRLMTFDYFRSLIEYIEANQADIDAPIRFFEKAPTEFQPGICEVFNVAHIPYSEDRKEWICKIDMKTFRYKLM